MVDSPTNSDISGDRRRGLFRPVSRNRRRHSVHTLHDLVTVLIKLGSSGLLLLGSLALGLFGTLLLYDDPPHHIPF